jgi:hypothetical protein
MKNRIIKTAKISAIVGLISIIIMIVATFLADTFLASSAFIGILIVALGIIAAIFIAIAVILGIVGYSIYFYRKEEERFGLAAKISVLLAIILFAANFLLESRIIVSAFSFTLFALAPLCWIINRIILLRRKEAKDVISAFLVIGLLFIPLTIEILFLLADTLPLIYTPPALTPENLPVYNRCIEFMKDHDDYKELGLDCYGSVSVSVEDGCSNTGKLADEMFAAKDLGIRERMDLFSKDAIVEMDRIQEGMRSIDCRWAKRENDIVLFVKLKSNFIFPNRPGVLYSLEGRNPNETDNPILNTNKPFIKIADNWYMSRHLVMSTRRGQSDRPIPKSLIDCSLQAKLNE